MIFSEYILISWIYPKLMSKGDIIIYLRIIYDRYITNFDNTIYNI